MTARMIAAVAVFFAFAHPVIAQKAPSFGPTPSFVRPAVPCGLNLCDAVSGAIVAIPARIDSPSIDAATNSAVNSDDKRNKPGFSGNAKPGGGMFNIQGNGIGLPAGVGSSGKGQAATEKTKTEETAKASDKAKGDDSKPSESRSSDGKDSKQNDSGDRKPADGKPSGENPRADNAVQPRPTNSPTACTGVGHDGQACGSEVNNPDPVAQRIKHGFENNPGVARPTDMKVKDTGVGTPTCFGESREGVDCK
ncbi:MAG TPA: hypothetical protein VKS43_12025 [Burkholderiales bacterium]|nr:hypothetical protein [Burkholderiales bacterium]